MKYSSPLLHNPPPPAALQTLTIYESAQAFQRQDTLTIYESVRAFQRQDTGTTKGAATEKPHRSSSTASCAHPRSVLGNTAILRQGNVQTGTRPR